MRLSKVRRLQDWYLFYLRFLLGLATYIPQSSPNVLFPRNSRRSTTGTSTIRSTSIWITNATAVRARLAIYMDHPRFPFVHFFSFSTAPKFPSPWFYISYPILCMSPLFFGCHISLASALRDCSLICVHLKTIPLSACLSFCFETIT